MTTMAYARSAQRLTETTEVYRMAAAARITDDARTSSTRACTLYLYIENGFGAALTSCMAGLPRRT